MISHNTLRLGFTAHGLRKPNTLMVALGNLGKPNLQEAILYYDHLTGLDIRIKVLQVRSSDYIERD